MINVTRKEFEKGWARARSVYSDIPAGGKANNAHRLLLFYAVENGLKALIMRLERIRDGKADFSVEKHNINRLLDRVGANQKMHIAKNIRMKSQFSMIQRVCSVGDINQMWRYGCVADNPTDADIESGLNALAHWIDGQLAVQ